MFDNLLSNAAKFSSTVERPLIEVYGETIGSDAHFHVRDNGAGFDMKYADKLFKVFHRLHPHNEYPGTGIGLALVKRIVERLDGTVSADGRYGEGATFSFSLPAAGFAHDRRAARQPDIARA